MSLRFGGEPDGVGRHRTVFEVSGNRSAVTWDLEEGERGSEAESQSGGRWWLLQDPCLFA